MVGALRGALTSPFFSPTTLVVKMVNDKLMSLYVPVYQQILNRWLVEVGINSGLVLLFITERTLRWGKEWEYIPQRHFIFGVTDVRTGEALHSGLPVSKSTLWACLSDVEERGLVGTMKGKGTSRGNRYCVHVERILAPLIRERALKSV